MSNFAVKIKNEFRQMPFWSLNDLLTESEMRRQVNEFHKAGFGGYFLHSRIGLVTPYMKEEWMKMLRAAIDEGKKLGMEPWLYDEDKWPSGYAGGAVSEINIENRLRYLMCIPENMDDIIIKKNYYEFYYPFKSKDDVAAQLKDSIFLKKISTPGKNYLLYIWALPMGDGQLNGSCYVDLMNPNTVQDFINSTHEKYKSEFGPLFGNLIPGIFTDEPTIRYPWPNIPFSYLPWTTGFDEIFEKINSYKISDHFDKLFFDIGNYSNIRYDYYKTLSDLFVESFSKKIFNWCTENDLIFTGHYLGEDNLLFNLLYNYSIMRAYEYQTYPGVDSLGEKIGKLITIPMIKQVTSVAEQLGKKRTLSETYGGAGWNMSMEQQKIMAEYQLVLGINFFTPHLAHYSLRGQRKRDYPASFFYQQPYWDDYHFLNDYLGSLCEILSSGKRVVNILFIHPIESVWAEYTPFDDRRVMERNEKFMKFSDELIMHQKDFHYADEDILSRHGKIKNGKLSIGSYEYDFIIFLDPLTIRKSTYEFVSNLLLNDYPVYFIDNYPVYFDVQVPDSDFSRFSKISYDTFFKEIDKYLPQNFVITGEKEKIIIHRRIIDEDEIFYLMNIDDSSSAKFDFSTGGNLELVKLDPVTGSTIYLQNTIMDDSVKVSLCLNPTETILLKKTKQKSLSKLRDNFIPKDTLGLENEWFVKESSVNSITLDNCRIKIPGTEDNISCNIIFVKNILKKHPGKYIDIQFEFMIQDINKIENEIYLISELIKNQRIFVNNHEIINEAEGWWIDISFKKYPIKEFLHEGMNIITLGVFSSLENEYESVYITGDFNVFSEDGITYKICPVRPLTGTGNLTLNGYPFFAGRMKLAKIIDLGSRKFEKAELKFDAPNAIVHNIYINGSETGNIIWKPYCLDITGMLREGRNEITCELVSSLRNLLGPLHNTNYHPVIVGPEQFDNTENWSDKYTLTKFGMPEKLRIEFY